MSEGKRQWKITDAADPGRAAVYVWAVHSQAALDQVAGKGYLIPMAEEAKGAASNA